MRFYILFFYQSGLDKRPTIRCEEFKQEIRSRLLKLDSKNEFVEKNKLSVVVARR